MVTVQQQLSTHDVDLFTPSKAKSGMKQYRYHLAGKDDSHNSEVGGEAAMGLGSQSQPTSGSGMQEPPLPVVTPPETKNSAGASSAHPSSPSPSPSSSASFLRKVLNSADEKLLSMQALCEADLRAVISGHEDLAERQQALLEDMNLNLMDANDTAEYFKKVTAKVTNNHCTTLDYDLHY